MKNVVGFITLGRYSKSCFTRFDFPGFLFIFILTLFCQWVARKFEARMQNCVGPMVAGPWGILQPWADFVKLIAKENFTPKDTSKTIFKIMPILSLTTFIFAMFFMPVDGINEINVGNVIPQSGFSGDLILVILLLSMANFFMFLSGWSSNNPYSKIGGGRILMLILGYDVPLFMLILSPALLSDSLSITDIVASQTASVPYALLIPLTMILFIFVIQAELEKDPFDIPHAETEVVGGYETEYNGVSLALLKLSKDVQIVLGSYIIVELFLGGPNGPIFFGWNQFWYTFWFVLKVLIVVIIMEYITNIFARIRIDQAMYINWRMLMPTPSEIALERGAPLMMINAFKASGS